MRSDFSVHTSGKAYGDSCADPAGISQYELLENLSILRSQTDRLLEQMKKDAVAANGNDTLYDELEMRYGGAFAQWGVDRL